MGTIDRELARADIQLRGVDADDPAWSEKTPVVSVPPPRPPQTSEVEVTRSGFRLRGLERWQVLLVVLVAEVVAGGVGFGVGRMKGWW